MIIFYLAPLYMFSAKVGCRVVGDPKPSLRFFFRSCVSGCGRAFTTGSKVASCRQCNFALCVECVASKQRTNEEDGGDGIDFDALQRLFDRQMDSSEEIVRLLLDASIFIYTTNVCDLLTVQ